MNDLQIIELFFSRDECAIKETHSKYGKLCFQIANNILSNDEDSEECVNDTYLTVWNMIPPTRPNNYVAFICKITRNLALKKLEFALAKKRTSNAVVSLCSIEETIRDDSDASDIEDVDLGIIISTFLYKEKEDSRNVFLRKYWFFDSISEIAKRYSFSESKVKSMLFHTRKRLKKYLKREGIEI